MSKKRQQITQPKTQAYKPASSFDLTTQTGRAQLWHERIRRARAMLDIDSREELAKLRERWVNGKFPSSQVELYLNEAIPALEDLLYSSFPTIPPFVIEERPADTENIGDAAGALLDAAIASDRSDVYEEIVAAEWNEIKRGIGILKTVWKQEKRRENPRIRPNTRFVDADPQIEIENANPLEAMVASNDDDMAHYLGHERGLNDWGIETDEYSALDSHRKAHLSRMVEKTYSYPALQSIHPSRFLYDPDAKKWSDRRWEAEQCDELVSALEAIPGIKNLNPDNCPTVDEFDNEQRPNRVSNDFDFAACTVRVWKIHDRENNSYVILPCYASAESKPLLESDWPYGGIDIYHPVVHHPIDDQIHGMATLEIIEPVLSLIAKTNAVIERMNRRAASYKMLGSSELDKKQIADITNEYLALATLPAQVLSMMKEYKPPLLAAELPAFRTFLEDRILRKLLGTDAIMQGGDTSHEISASEAQGRIAAQQGRVDRRMLRISKLLEWVGYNFLMLYHDLADEELLIRVAGPMGTEFKRLNPAMLTSDLEVKIDLESVSPAKLSADAATATQFAAMCMKLAPELMDKKELLTWLAAKQRIRNPQKLFADIQQMMMPPAESPNQESTPQSAGLPESKLMGQMPALPELVPQL